MSSAIKVPAPEIAVGTVLGGKYRVDSLLAEGGMSFVYTAKDSSLDERVALKVLKPDFRGQKDVLARFVREAKTIRRIQSDHCVKVLEVGMDPDHGPFMVMEFLEGNDLRTILDSGGKLVPRRACELAIQVCEALAAAHTSDCIHRDIKPDNIVVLSRGELEQVRVLDFGISKHSLTGSVLNQDLSLVSTINLMGTPMYMSPEQMRSTSGADWRTDIWSLGAMLYEMLTGRPPFVSESITEVCSMVIEDEPAPLTVVEPTVPEALAAAVAKCLQKKPADRFQNVGELALALMPFAPRRARAGVEKILTTLAAAGVAVDRSMLSQAPPPSGASAPPISIPTTPAVPRVSGMVPIARQATQPSVANDDPVVTIEPEPQRRKWPFVLFGLVALLAFAGVLGVMLLRAQGKVETPPPPAAAVVAPTTTPAPSPAPSPEPSAAATVVTELDPAPPSSVAPAARPTAPAWATAPVKGRPTFAAPGASAPPKSSTPAPSVATPASKVRLVDDEPSRPKVLD